jgi:predicted transcriptional regulator of viral defense system
MEFQEAIAPYAEEPITKQIIFDLLREYRRPNDKINELIKKGLLVAVKKGFYIPGPALKITKPESFLVANHLYGPSYISMESALSYWGLIPERVFETTSITIKRSKEFKTAIGRFSYLHAASPYYSFGIKSVKLTEKQVVMIASPEKALCDKIVMTSGVFLRSTIQARQFLVDDLRIDVEALRRIDNGKMASWIEDSPKKTSIEMLIKTLHNL